MARHWLFILALSVQVLIVALVPARRAMSLWRGDSVLVHIAPVDPYDVLSGYYVVLRYRFSDPGAVPDLGSYAQGDTVYVELARRDDGAWHAVGARRQLDPDSLPAHRKLLRGHIDDGAIDFGVERFYIPEGTGQAIERGMREHPDAAFAELRIDSSGAAALLRLHIDGTVYED